VPFGGKNVGPYLHADPEMSILLEREPGAVRSKISLEFDIVEAGEKKQCASVMALLCGENHFFFVRTCDVRIRATNRQEA
jgi:hypothetical protein